MNRSQIPIRISLAVLAVAVLIGSAKAGEQVPFKGNLEGLVSVTPLIGNPDFDVHVDVHGRGTATQLGMFSVSIPHDVDRRPPPNPAFAAGEYTFTSANGDTVRAEFTGQATLFAPDVLYIEERGTIVGGTGRFADARGSFVVKRLFMTIYGTTFGSIEGTISSPGSK